VFVSWYVGRVKSQDGAKYVAEAREVKKNNLKKKKQSKRSAPIFFGLW
jgi:uncharacterized ion transporter superfamily protein YfcC